MLSVFLQKHLIVIAFTSEVLDLIIILLFFCFVSFYFLIILKRFKKKKYISELTLKSFLNIYVHIHSSFFFLPSDFMPYILLTRYLLIQVINQGFILSLTAKASELQNYKARKWCSNNKLATNMGCISHILHHSSRSVLFLLFLFSIFPLIPDNACITISMFPPHFTNVNE